MAEASPARGTPDRDIDHDVDRDRNQQHLTQAAEWFAVLQDSASDEDHRAWRAWRDADPAHAAAWQRVEAINSRFLSLAGQVDRRAAASAIDTVRSAGASRRRSLKLLGVLGLSCSVGVLTWRAAPWQDLIADAHTGVGERREFRLPDGTILHLNTDTAVQVAYGTDERRVELLRGEVLVKTGPDAAGRPWRLTTAEGTLEARGTRFSVWRDDADCRLAVFDGEVAVRCAGTGAQRVVAAGQQARFDRSAVGEVRTAPATLSAWVRGLYVAEGLSLAEVSRDLARHRRGLITCDERVAALRVVGTFPLDDDPQLWRALTRALPIKVSSPLPWWTRIEAA
ncbi:FecR domain-containing protein [Roseateles sp. L2-2]|uniref:FecR domain-containing protein n=1 Tax=Roseateles TaxID=93681 RepID=UPI003D368AB9